MPWRQAAAFCLNKPGSAAASAEPSGWSDGDYWSFADRMQTLLEPSWDEVRGAYYPHGPAGQTSHNANLLVTHAAADRALAATVAELRALDIVRAVASVLRVEGE